MKINGKWVFLDNHSIENSKKMYQWSIDKELIEIELGRIDKSKNINDYENNIMNSYIENNHESNSIYCHFGIYRKYNDELIGYLDFQNINENGAELSLSIPDKEYRNKHYGIDAVLIALEYGFNKRNLENIIMRTRIDNIIVKNMCKKVGINYEIEHFAENNYNIGIVKYIINKDMYEKIINKIFKKII